MTTTRRIAVFAAAAVLAACLGMFPAAAADKAAPEAKAQPTAADSKAAGPTAKGDAKTAKGGGKKEPEFPLPDDPRPYADSPYAKEIDRGLNFLVKDKSFGRWSNLAYLDLLQRKFGLHKRYSIAESFSESRRAEADTQMMALFGRITDAGHTLDIAKLPPVITTHPVISSMLKALYCDQNPLPADFVASLALMLETHQKMQPRTAETEYAITNIALDYQWLKENGCATDAPGFAEFKDKVSAALVDVIKSGGLRRDAGYASAALLYYLDCGAAVEKAWVDEIAAAQQIDGGWAYAWDAKMGVSDGHPTVFALWALLEASLPNAPKTPMIPRAAVPAGDKAAAPGPEKAAEQAPEKK